MGGAEPLPLMRATRLARAGSSASSFTGMPSRSSTACEVFGGLGFIARRIGGVDAQQRGEVAEGFGIQFAAVNGVWLGH